MIYITASIIIFLMFFFTKVGVFQDKFLKDLQMDTDLHQSLR